MTANEERGRFEERNGGQDARPCRWAFPIQWYLLCLGTTNLINVGVSYGDYGNETSGIETAVVSGNVSTGMRDILVT